MSSIEEQTNPLDDSRVMLSLSIDDIEQKAEDLGIDFKKLDIENVFYQTRKYLENGAMDMFWDALDSAILESVLEK